MKKIICILSTMFAALLLMACNGLSFSGSRMGNGSQLIMKYSVFNTTDSQYFEMDQGDVIDADIVSDSGKLSVTVQSEDGETVYENEDVPTGAFQIEIKKKGIYKIKVTGKKAKGSLSFIKNSEQDTLEANMTALNNSYYEGQSSRAFQMLQKSIFKKLLLNGWLDEIEDMENARWNYDTFTKYTVINQDQAAAGDQGELYCCTFSADNDRYGYIVLSYSGDGLSKIRAAETAYLYDFLSERDQIKKELEKSGVDLSTASALRAEAWGEDDSGPEEGIYFTDNKGSHYFYSFSQSGLTENKNRGHANRLF